MVNIAFLDTDFLLKTYEIKVNGVTLLDKIFELKYNFHIHSKIIFEINNSVLKTYLTQKKLDKQLIVDDDKKIFSMLEVAYSSETLAIKRILDWIKKFYAELKNDENKFYEDNFKILEKYFLLKSSLQSFIDELTNVEKELGNGNSIGELKTCLAIAIYSNVLEDQVFSFLSHDNDARYSLIEVITNNLCCFSCFSIFIPLTKHNILDKELGKQYITSWINTFKDNITVKCYNKSKQKQEGINLRTLFFGYIVPNKAIVLFNGLIQI